MSVFCHRERSETIQRSLQSLRKYAYQRRVPRGIPVPKNLTRSTAKDGRYEVMFRAKWLSTGVEKRQHVKVNGLSRGAPFCASWKKVLVK